MGLISEQAVEEYFKGQSVLVLGSAPCVLNISAEEMDEFDIIVRLNNYKFFNDCRRVDVYYSFFGGTIEKPLRNVREDNPDFLMFKYPDMDFRKYTGGKTIEGKGSDFRYVCRSRKQWIIEFDSYIQTERNFISNLATISSIPTTGVAAILDIVRYTPDSLHIAGYDFFSSRLHNITEHWSPKQSGGADLGAERVVVDEMLMNGMIQTKPGWMK